MIWETLLGTEETIAVPWLGGRAVTGDGRSWKIRGALPPEFGWHEFRIDGSRKATWKGESSVEFERLEGHRATTGYLVGDRLIPDGAQVAPDPRQIIRQTLKVHLAEPGLDRFARIRAVHYEQTAWVFDRQEFPLGPEATVTEAFEDRSPSVANISEVTPALELAFRFESWQRDEAELRRQLREEAECTEAARRQQFEARRELERSVGTAEGRRRLAQHDFEAAARAALAVSGAELLDWRRSRNKREAVVKFRYQRQRFECVVHTETLRIIDSGICLIDHANDVRGDTRFTLESLPAVIAQAIREGRLVIFRRA